MSKQYDSVANASNYFSATSQGVDPEMWIKREQSKNCMSSIAAAESIIDTILEKVAHKKYMDEIDSKI